MTNTFVDLNRTFTKIDSSSEFTYEKRHTFDNFFDFGNNITWDELINSDSINVILGEAGSGKTEEFKYQANKLYKNGYASFFIELEKLIDKSDPQAFDTEFERQLKEWKNETGNAYFFLDSIDESKFTKRSDFHNAIRNFKRLVGTNNLDRCKIILSSRHSEWHPETDVNIINELKRENKEQVKTEDNIDSLGNSKGIISFDDTVSNEDESENKIGLFRLNPLNSSQVELLSEQFLDENPQEFINAINIANVRSFAERPLDLKGLILIWKEKGKLGSFKEILDHHISNGIRETHFRQDKDILTPDRAKSGVKYLAAAVLLTKRQKICTIDSGKDAIVNAILPQVCLPGDWSDKEIKFLLQRRLFDEATFNTIKFHLRSTTEYLCALWFKDYLDRSDDYISVKDIFFNEDNSELILKDSYKPIVAWLSIGDRPWNERLRNDIINAFPELFLNYGDPSELSKNYLLDILDALRKKHGKSKFIYAEENVRSLSCIGKDEFVENFREWIRDQDIAEEFKRLLLSIALNSKMNGLSGLAKEIAISRDSHNRNRILSIHYLGEVESEKNLRSLKRFLFTEDNLSNSIIAASIEALYPDNLTNGELLTLLKKTNEIDEHALGIEYQLYRHIEFVGDSLSVNQLHTLIKNLIALINMPPLEGYFSVSKKYYWVGNGLFSATKELLRKKNNDIDWTILAKAIYQLKTLKRGAKGVNQIKLDEFEIIENNSELRRTYFWYSYKRLYEDRKKQPVYLNQIFGGLSGISEPKFKDIEWLIKDSQISDKREIALSFVQRYWDQFNRPVTKYLHLKKLCGDDKELKKIFSIKIGYYLKSKYKGLKYKFGIYDWSVWFEKKKIVLKRKREDLREKKIIYKNIRRIYRGRHTQILSHLSYKCLADSGRYSRVDLSKIKKSYSKIIIWAFRKGVKKYWLTFKPNLPQLKPNTTDVRTIIGFVGINLSIQDKELIFSKISDELAQQLVFYAVNELNGFPDWLEKLTEEKPDSVVTVFKKCIDKDWELTPEDKPIINVIGRIRTSADYLIPLVNDSLFDNISKSIPLSYSVLKEALSVIVLSDLDRIKIIEVCQNKINREVLTKSEYVLWISKLNLVDGKIALKFVEQINLSIKRELLLWIGVWIQLNAKSAINFIEELLTKLNEKQGTDFIVGLCSILESRSSYGYPNVDNPDYLKPEIFKQWYLIVYTYINPQDDVVRTGTYTPDSRDHAQDFRRKLLDRFIHLYPKETKTLLNQLLKHPNLQDIKDQLRHRQESIYQVFADQEIWDPEDIQNFLEEHEVDPKSTYGLFKTVFNRLNNIKDEIERDEHGINLNSIRKVLIAGDDEAELRKFLTRQLKEKSNGKYIVAAEEEINPKVDPDIRIHKNSFEPISIEIKWAQRWSGPDLFKKLKEQLVDQYLRAPNCNYGIYIIGFIKEEGLRENWMHPETRNSLDYQGLIDNLQQEAKLILKQDHELNGLSVIGLNFND